MGRKVCTQCSIEKKLHTMKLKMKHQIKTKTIV